MHGIFIYICLGNDPYMLENIPYLEPLGYDIMLDLHGCGSRCSATPVAGLGSSGISGPFGLSAVARELSGDRLEATNHESTIK